MVRMMTMRSSTCNDILVYLSMAVMVPITSVNLSVLTLCNRHLNCNNTAAADAHAAVLDGSFVFIRQQPTSILIRAQKGK